MGVIPPTSILPRRGGGGYPLESHIHPCGLSVATIMGIDSKIIKEPMVSF